MQDAHGRGSRDTAPTEVATATIEPQESLVSTRQLRPEAAGHALNEDDLEFANLIDGLNRAPPDETAVARLVQICPSCGRGEGLLSDRAGLEKGATIYYWGEIINGAEHRRKYAAAPGQYVMVW
jgi:hypothetical protein